MPPDGWDFTLVSTDEVAELLRLVDELRGYVAPTAHGRCVNGTSLMHLCAINGRPIDDVPLP